MAYKFYELEKISKAGACLPSGHILGRPLSVTGGDCRFKKCRLIFHIHSLVMSLFFSLLFLLPCSLSFNLGKLPLLDQFYTSAMYLCILCPIILHYSRCYDNVSLSLGDSCIA